MYVSNVKSAPIVVWLAVPTTFEDPVMGRPKPIVMVRVQAEPGCTMPISLGGTTPAPSRVPSSGSWTSLKYTIDPSGMTTVEKSVRVR